MNIKKNFGFKLFLKMASNVARSDTDIGSIRSPAEISFLRWAICVTMSLNAAREMWLSLHRFPDACPNGILKVSKEKASDGIHPSKSAS